MSLTGVRLISGPLSVVDEDGLKWKALFRMTATVAGVNDGGATVLVEGTTESEVRSLMAQAMADNANLNTSDVEAFTATDVIGGAI